MTTPLNKLREIDAEVAKIDERLASLENAPHVPRKDTPTILTPLSSTCDPTCPTCALERELYKRRGELGEPQRAALVKNARKSFRDERRRSDNAKAPRNRKPNLWDRGFRRIIKEYPSFTARQLRDLLRNQPVTFDDYGDEDISLYLDGDDVVVEDLETGETQSVAKINQPQYLRRATLRSDINK